MKQENQKLSVENCSLDKKVISLESTNTSLNKIVRDIKEEISLLTSSRNKLKKDNEELNKKLKTMEEELFVSKNMQLQLMSKMKVMET